MKPYALLLLMGLSVAAFGGKPLDWETLRLASDDDARHLRTLLKAVPARTSGWKHYPLRVGGNFLTERWMKGEGQVLNQHFMETAGSAWYQVEALHYDLPDAFGCLLSAGRNPDQDGLGVRFWYASGGQRIVGEGADLDFSVWRNGKVVAKLPVLRTPIDLPEPYEVEGDVPNQGWRANLAALTDPESFQASTVVRYDGALAGFGKSLAEGRVKKRVYGEYHGDGIPPESHLEPITADEAEMLRRHAESEVAGWKSGLAKHGPEMYQALHDLVPLQALTD